MEKMCVKRSGRSFVNLCSLVGFFLLLSILSAFLSTAAASWYIKPSAEFPLRRGQGTDYKILAIVPADTEVTILEEDESWARVTTQDGKEGWILKRYLSREKPLHLTVETLRQENVPAMEKNDRLLIERDEAAGRILILQQELDGCLADLASTREQYRALMEDSVDIVETKKNLEQSRQNTLLLQEQFTSLSAEIENLQKNQDIKWFLAGVGTLVSGFIFGIILSRSRKKKPSLY
jgi:SH3 domain protein